MKTRRIFAQPGEPIEIINYLGTSILKVAPMFDGSTTYAVLYPQPGVEIITADGKFETDFGYKFGYESGTVHDPETAILTMSTTK